MRLSVLSACLALAIRAQSSPAASAAAPAFRAQEIANDLTVGYAVRLVDLNADGRLDILVVDSQRVIWYENPSWQVHVVLLGQTRPDNVCVAPCDIDGDGRLDLALGADWRPADTLASGSIDWLTPGRAPSDHWRLHPIGVEPTVHRMQWADVAGDARPELLVVPLHGRGATPPQFAEQGVRILAYPLPADPLAGPWEPLVLNADLHVVHNFQPVDLDRDGRADILLASFEGVSWLHRGEGDRWQLDRLGEGNQQTSPNRGASEIKLGTLADGRQFIATIEPWHGFQVVVYLRPATGKLGEALWPRQVIDERLQWGHAVWCADLDGEAGDELAVGVRDTRDPDNPCGVRVYSPSGDGSAWTAARIDPGGVTVEDLAVADLDGDGRADIVAVGRATHNVRIYWNQPR